MIQHHDTIVTSSDLGLAVACQYDLTNKTVANEVDLGIQGDVKTGLSEEVIVDSPNVAMRITDRSGDDTIASAEVGDPLVFNFLSCLVVSYSQANLLTVDIIHRPFDSRFWTRTRLSKYLSESWLLWMA